MTSVRSRWIPWVQEGPTQAATVTGGMAVECLAVSRTGVDVALSILVPTRNESGNIAPLIGALAAAIPNGTGAEVLFVDDSSDDTPHVIRQVAQATPLTVRLLHRPVGARLGGLSGAVIAGMRAARGSWLVVMDGDLQHPPHLAPLLAQVGTSRQVDLVAASRYIGQGCADGLSSGIRHVASEFSGSVAKILFPVRLQRLSDPMSGFFAVRRSAIDLERMRPDGFKILLETMVRHPRLKVAEVPFTFGDRFEGESKASIKEGVRYLGHLVRLRASSFVASSARPMWP